MPQIKRRVMRVKKQNKPWPGLSSRLSDVMNVVLQGRIPSNLADVTIKREKLWHRQLYAAAGQQTLTYFNANAADYVTNLQGNALQNEQAFCLQRVNVSIETGILTTGLFDTAGQQLIVTAGAGSTAVVLAEQCRELLIAGQMRLKIGDKTLVNQKDLTNFPAGHGFHMPAAAVGGTVTAQSNLVAAPFQNGSPLDVPWMFKPWYPILPGKPISCTLNWQGLLAVTSAVTYIVVELEGITITPSNL